MSVSEFQRQAALIYLQSANDLTDALQAKKNDNRETCLLLCVQSAVNRLNAVCTSQKRLQNPTYNLSDMLKVCAAVYPDFERLQEPCFHLDDVQSFRLFDEFSGGGRRITPKVLQDFYEAARKILSVSREIITVNKPFEPDIKPLLRLRFLIIHRCRIY